MEKQKSKIVFALLAWFFGGFGAQYFYVGKTKAGIIVLLTNWICLWGAIVAAIQAIMALIKSQEWFDEKFVNSDKTLPLF